MTNNKYILIGENNDRHNSVVIVVNQARGNVVKRCLRCIVVKVVSVVGE